MKTKNKLILLALCAVLVVCGSVLGTVAFLKSQSEVADQVVTIGQVHVVVTDGLAEQEDGAELLDALIPGTSIQRDAKARVLAGSEDCYLFVKFEESEGLSSLVKYEIADGWTELADDVYYRVVSSPEEDQAHDIFRNGQISVLSSVTEEKLNSLEENPSLTFDVYACQMQGFATAEAAWAKIGPSNT